MFCLRFVLEMARFGRDHEARLWCGRCGASWVETAKILTALRSRVLMPTLDATLFAGYRLSD